MLVWVAYLLHSSLYVFPFLKNLLSSSSTAFRHILDRFLSIELSSSGLNRILDSFSIHQEFFLCFLSSWQILDRFSIHRDFWVISQYLLDRISIDTSFIEISRFDLDSFSTDRSIHRAKILCSLSARHILEKFSTHWGWLLLNRLSTPPRSIEIPLHAFQFSLFCIFFPLRPSHLVFAGNIN